MDYNKGVIRMVVRNRVNEIFNGIINDIPNSEICSNNSLIGVHNNGFITYEKFYNVIYRTVLEYVPKEDENPLLKAIKMLPKAVSNIKGITKNNKIRKIQTEILNKYFYDAGADNIKEKLTELENTINELIEQGELEIIEEVLSRFDDRMRKGLLSDLEHLSNQLESR